MGEENHRFWNLFFEVYEHLPRQGPGNRACAARAIGLCSELQAFPAILDLGCGVGGQTFQLAELSSGTILAVDSHLAAEPEMHRRYADWYAYEFFVARRPSA